MPRAATMLHRLFHTKSGIQNMCPRFSNTPHTQAGPQHNGLRSPHALQSSDVLVCLSYPSLQAHSCGGSAGGGCSSSSSGGWRGSSGCYQESCSPSEAAAPYQAAIKGGGEDRASLATMSGSFHPRLPCPLPFLPLSQIARGLLQKLMPSRETAASPASSMTCHLGSSLAPYPLQPPAP